MSTPVKPQHPRKIVVIGGVAGGASAATKARRVDEHADIVVFERGPYVSFANCGLPYFISDAIPKREQLLLQTPESLWNRFRLRVMTGHEVLRIDRAAKRVEVKRLADGTTFFESYDKLILSPGAGAIVPELPGLPARNVFTVKTIPEAEAVRGWLTELTEQRQAKAVVVGAGFIGLETAEALVERGLDVTLVELLPQVLPPLAADAAARGAGPHAARGGSLVLSYGLAGFAGGARATSVILKSGRALPADLVILSIGVRPELKLARDAGLTIGATGALAVDVRQQTSDPDIYAVGDAVETVQLVTGKPARIALAGPANKQGRVAGANAAGGNMTFPGALGTSIVECLGVTAAKTGLSEREAAQAGLFFTVTWVHPLDHAGYYPGATPLHLKLIAEKATGRLLGAQVVGAKGVDKRIDVLATALQARLSVSDLEDLDLAYAPQFSSAKDPVLMAAFTAANTTRGEVASVTWKALSEEQATDLRDLQLVDVRTAQERARGYLPGSVHIPIDDLRGRLADLDPLRETVIYCQAGQRGYFAARVLKQRGFERVRNLTGGLLSCPASAVVHPSIRPFLASKRRFLASKGSFPSSKAPFLASKGSFLASGGLLLATNGASSPSRLRLRASSPRPSAVRLPDDAGHPHVDEEEAQELVRPERPPERHPPVGFHGHALELGRSRHVHLGSGDCGCYSGMSHQPGLAFAL